MIGDDWMVAVFCMRPCVMCCLEESASMVVTSPSPGRAVVGELASVFLSV